MVFYMEVIKVLKSIVNTVQVWKVHYCNLLIGHKLHNFDTDKCIFTHYIIFNHTEIFPYDGSNDWSAQPYNLFQSSKTISMSTKLH